MHVTRHRLSYRNSSTRLRNWQLLKAWAFHGKGGYGQLRICGLDSLLCAHSGQPMSNPHHCPGLLILQSWTLPAHLAAYSGPDSTPAALEAASHQGRAVAATRCCGNRSPSASAGSVHVVKRNHTQDEFLDPHSMKGFPSQPTFSLISPSQQHGLFKPLHSLPAELASPETPPGFATRLCPGVVSIIPGWEMEMILGMLKHCEAMGTCVCGPDLPPHLLLNKVLLIKLQ